MSRRWFVSALVLVVLALFSTIAVFLRPAQAASTGCATAVALSGSYAPGASGSTGSQTFIAGEIFTATHDGPVVDGETLLHLTISGAASSDSTDDPVISYTIPTDGTYNVTIENASIAGYTFTITVTCDLPAPVATDTPTATPTSTATNTPPPTNTPTSTNTATNVPTNTATPTNTRTNTATNIPTNTRTNTRTATNTPTKAPTNTPTRTATASQTLTPTSAVWSGFTDGRLSPLLGENYSLWCRQNQLEIYRSVNGQGVLITTISVPQVLTVPIGGAVPFITSTGPIILRRPSASVYFVEGNNGTNAPAFASKFFFLADCVASSVLPPTPTNTRTPTPIPPTNTPTPVPPTRTPVSTSSTSGSGAVTLLLAFYGVGPTATPNGTPTATIDPVLDPDGDGVTGTRDHCPTLPGTRAWYGCPDSDGDGVNDAFDLCPQEVGATAMFGCGDSDGDGVSNYFDLCPTRAPPTTRPSARGCPDQDGDGFPTGVYPNGQPMDWCPFAGQVPGYPGSFMGCPDPDGDGYVADGFPLVPDSWIDVCPLNAYVTTVPCPADQQLLELPIGDSTTYLFEMANLLGSFDNLVVDGYESASSCSTASYGFCLPPD